MTLYYHAESDAWVKIKGPEFTIIGDAELVTDADILRLADDDIPEGWHLVDTLAKAAAVNDELEMGARLRAAVPAGGP